jgi:hypothetical protein
MLRWKPAIAHAVAQHKAPAMPKKPTNRPDPNAYQTAYDNARAAVINYPRGAIRMQLGRLAATARTEAQWGFVDALADLLLEDAEP